MRKAVTGLAMICSLSLEACSSRPREFTPTVAPASNQANFEDAYATCRELLAENKLTASGRSKSLAAGAGTGAGTAAVGGSVAAMAGGWGGAAIAGATVVLLPFAIVGGAWGMSRARRARKERATKTALQGCLEERGFQVAGWSQAIKKPVVVKSGAPAGR